MAKTNSTADTTSEARTFSFTAADGLYQLNPLANEADIRSQLHMRIGHLRALLEATYGVGEENFSGLPPAIRDNYMWACSTIAEECYQLSKL